MTIAARTAEEQLAALEELRLRAERVHMEAELARHRRAVGHADELE